MTIFPGSGNGADAMRRSGEKKQAMKLLNAVAEKSPSAPEAVAARELIKQIKESN